MLHVVVTIDRCQISPVAASSRCEDTVGRGETDTAGSDGWLSTVNTAAMTTTNTAAVAATLFNDDEDSHNSSAGSDLLQTSQVCVRSQLRPSSVDCVSSWAVRPILAVQRRPQTVQIRLLDGAASSELEFAARR